MHKNIYYICIAKRSIAIVRTLGKPSREREREREIYMATLRGVPRQGVGDRIKRHGKERGVERDQGDGDR